MAHPVELQGVISIAPLGNQGGLQLTGKKTTSFEKAWNVPAFELAL